MGNLLRAGMAVAAVFFGAAAVFLGILLVFSAITSGTIHLSYGDDGKVVSESVARAADAARFWKLVFGLGILPAAIGAFMTRWGWRTVNRR